MLGSLLKNLARPGLLLLVVCLSLSMIVMAQDSRVLTAGIPVSGTLDEGSLAQVYTYTAVPGDVVTISASGDLPLALVLTDVSGEIIAQSVDAEASGSVLLEEITLEQGGQYYLTVFAAPGATVTLGDFTLTLTSTAAEQPDVTSEPDGSPATVTFQPPGEILTSAGLRVELTWNSTADMNLQVRDPVGRNLYWDSTTTDNGGSFGFDVNGLCEVLTENATETATWPAGPISTGSWEILIYYRQACENTDPVTFTVNVIVDGVPLAPIQGTLLPPLANSDSVYLASFVIAEDGTVSLGDNGVYVDALSTAVSNMPTPIPVTREVVTPGVITSDQPYVTYSFTGQANENVSVSMSASSGNLDTLLYLVGPGGNIVASNDDAVGTDSQLTTRLVVDGEYTIVATRYGQIVGGTQGDFQLFLSNQTSPTLNLDLPEGDIEISLVWDTGADLQLLVRDSAGDSVYDDQPISPSGGRLALAGNVNCVRAEGQPVSYIYWPIGFLRGGSYEVEVWYQNACNDLNPVEFTLNVVVRGQLVFTDRVRPLPDQRYLTNFRVELDGTVTVGESGIIGGSETIDFQSEITTAMPIISGQSVTGSIRQENTFDLYSFQGQTGDVVTISMQGAGGSLDTRLLLIGPSGSEVAENDDEVPGENTNSLIDRFVLPADGEYIIIATRYGTVYGGTEGTYNLRLLVEN